MNSENNNLNDVFENSPEEPKKVEEIPADEVTGKNMALGHNTEDPNKQKEPEDTSAGQQWQQPGTTWKQQQNYTNGSSGYGYYQPYNNYYERPNHHIQQQMPTRRVGTITMGLSLIVAGLVSVYGLINPNFDIITIAKLSPLILVFIGIEIIIAYFWGKGQKLRYDWLSGFICFLLITASLGFAVATPLVKYYGPDRHRTEERLSQEIYDSYYGRLKGIEKISGMSVYVSLNGIEYDKEMTSSDLSTGDNVRLRISLMEGYKTKQEFAKDVKEILGRLGNVNILDYLSFESDGDELSFSLQLNDKFVMDMSAEKLAERVEVYGTVEEDYIDESTENSSESVFVESQEQALA